MPNILTFKQVGDRLRDGGKSEILLTTEEIGDIIASPHNLNDLKAEERLWFLKSVITGRSQKEARDMIKSSKLNLGVKAYIKDIGDTDVDLDALRGLLKVKKFLIGGKSFKSFIVQNYTALSEESKIRGLKDKNAVIKILKALREVSEEVGRAPEDSYDYGAGGGAAAADDKPLLSNKAISKGKGSESDKYTKINYGKKRGERAKQASQKSRKKKDGWSWKSKLVAVLAFGAAFSGVYRWSGLKPRDTHLIDRLPVWLTGPVEYADDLHDAIVTKDTEAAIGIMNRAGISGEKRFVWEATYHNSADIVKEMLERGPSYSDLKQGDKSLLEFAILGRSNDVVSMLLKNGYAEPNEQNFQNFSMLSMAVRASNPVALQLLLEAGADPLLNSQGDGEDVWETAEADNAPAGATRLLLVNRGDENLMWEAAESSDTPEIREVVRLLLEDGRIDPDLRVDGNTPLYRAIAMGNNNVVSALLEDGRVNRNALNSHGESVLSAAVRTGNIEAVRLLSQAGADLNLVSIGNTPLELAGHIGATEIADLLRLEIGANRDEASPSGSAAGAGTIRVGGVGAGGAEL